MAWSASVLAAGRVQTATPYRSPFRYDPLLSRPTEETSRKPKPKTLPPPPPRKLWYFNLFSEFSGPSADFALPLESYSFGNDYYAPMKLYTSANLGYNLTVNQRIGVEQGTDWPLQDDVVNAYDQIYASDFVFYDPVVYYQYFNFLNNSYSWVDGKVSLDIPISEFSRNVDYITGLYNGYIWNFRLANSSFYFALNLDLYLFFYKNQVGWNRFSTIVGHNWGWYIAPRWMLDTVSYFDFALSSQGNGNYRFNPNSVDRVKITLRFQPIINKIQLGAFVQAPIYDRKLNRTAVGLNFNYWL